MVNYQDGKGGLGLYSSGSRYGPLAASRAFDNALSGFINGGEFLTGEGYLRKPGNCIKLFTLIGCTFFIFHNLYAIFERVGLNFFKNTLTNTNV